MNQTDKDQQRKILQRLRVRTVGMTSRELARSLKIRVSDLNRELLQLQQSGLLDRQTTTEQLLTATIHRILETGEAE